MAGNDYSPIGIGVGSLISGRYEITRKLGSGAMSAVYSVVDRKLNNEEVALKLLAPAITEDPSAVDRFRNELVLTRKLTHPNIIRTYEFGETDKGLLYITMEKVKGSNLETILYHRGGKGLELKEIIFYLHEICQSIAYAHEMGVVHRDLKPGNVLVGTNGTVKIADFGLARTMVVSDRFTKTGESVGTPAYMAPEQIEDRNPDHRVDIYAIGIIGYELLTGKAPFQANTWYELAKQIIEKPLPELGKQRKDVPMWLQLMLEKAAQKSPAKRFASAREMADILSPHLEVLPPGYGLNIIYTQHTRATMPGLGVETPVTRILSSPRVLRMMPILFMMALTLVVLIIFIAIGQKNKDEVKEFKDHVENKVGLINRVADTFSKLLKVADQYDKDQEKVNKYLINQELLNAQPSSGDEAIPSKENVEKSDKGVGQ